MSALDSNKIINRKNNRQILIQKSIIFLIFASAVSSFLHPDMFLSFTLSEIFAFIALCPSPMFFGKEKEKFNHLFVPIIGILFLLTTLLLTKSLSINLIPVLIFLTISVFSIRAVHFGTHYLCMILAPVVTFIGIECGRGLIGQIFTDLKLFTESRLDYFNLIIPYILSILFLYALLNFIFCMSKERKIAFYIFGFLCVILCLVNTLSMLVITKPFSIVETNALIEAVKAVQDWKTILTIKNILTVEVLSTLIYPCIYFSMVSSLTGKMGFIPKRERMYRCILFVFLIVIVILYSKSMIKVVTPTEHLKTFLFTLF